MKFDRLFKYFPPVQFLKPKHIGISFSDTSIKAMLFSGTAKKPVMKSVVVPMEKGAIVSGSIANMDEVVKKLSIVRENFDSPFAFFAIPDELVYVFSANVPAGSKGDIKESVAFIMEENVPLALDDIVFDFAPVRIVQADSEYSATVAVAAAVRRDVEKFVEAFHKAGFEPVGCIPESQAIAKAVIPKKSIGTFCIVHARENRIGIHMIRKNAVHFSTIRNITSGDYKKEFFDEYEKFLEYCSKYDVSPNQPIKSVFICGEFDYAKKIAEAIVDSASQTKDVKLSNVWANIFEIDKYLPDITYEKSLGLAGAIGVAISDIN